MNSSDNPFLSLEGPVYICMKRRKKKGKERKKKKNEAKNPQVLKNVISVPLGQSVLLFLPYIRRHKLVVLFQSEKGLGLRVAICHRSPFCVSCMQQNLSIRISDWVTDTILNLYLDISFKSWGLLIHGFSFEKTEDAVASNRICEPELWTMQPKAILSVVTYFCNRCWSNGHRSMLNIFPGWNMYIFVTRTSRGSWMLS